MLDSSVKEKGTHLTKLIIIGNMFYYLHVYYAIMNAVLLLICRLCSHPRVLAFSLFFLHFVLFGPFVI